MTNTIQAEGANPSVFVLNDLKAADVWQMTRILKRLNLRQVREQIDTELLKDAAFKAPMEMTEDGPKPLPEDKWTKKQVEAKEKAEAAKDEVMWQVLGFVMDSIGNCEADINKLLAMGCGVTAEQIAAMDANVYVDLIAQYVTREGFGDFFMHALSLLKRTKLSRESIASAVMSTR